MSELVVSFFLLVGAAFVLVGGIGLVRLPDYFMRLHAPTKATTLGVGGMLIASMVHFLVLGEPELHELLITLFLFVTAPVSAHMMARAGLRLRLRSRAPLPAREER